MSGPFNVGDVVVCVDAQPERFNQPATLKERAVYRVQSVGVTMFTLRPAIDVGIRDIDGSRALFFAGRFRHLRKADEQFTEQMRAIKPIRKQVKA